MELDFLNYNDACRYYWVKQEQSEIKAKIIKVSHSCHQVLLFSLYSKKSFFPFAVEKKHKSSSNKGLIYSLAKDSVVTDLSWEFKKSYQTHRSRNWP